MQTEKAKGVLGKIAKVLALTFGAFIVLIIIAVNSAPQEKKATTGVPAPAYTEVWNDDGGVLSIAITPEDATEEKLRALGAALNDKYSHEAFVRVSIFTDKASAALLPHYIHSPDSPLPADQDANYEKTFVAQYNKKESANFNSLFITLEGVNGSQIEVSY